MSKPKLGWARLNVAAQVLKARTIVTRMTGNVNYTTPVPPLADISTAATALETAESDAADGGSALKAIRDVKRAALAELMKTLMKYIALTSGGDRVKILSAGVEVAKEPEPRPKPEQVKKVSATPGGDPGKVDLKWEVTPNATGYVVEQLMPATDTQPATWVIVHTGTKTKWTATGLTSGSFVQFRIAATNAREKGDYSQTVTSVVP